MDGPYWILCMVLVFVALSCALVTSFLIRFGVMAYPNARSAHKTPEPTAGGFAVVLGLIGGVTALRISGVIGDDSALLTLIGLGSGAALLGFGDDVFEIPAKIKFGAIGVLSLVMALILGPVTILPFDHGGIVLPWIVGVFGTALWVFTLINAVNFMDGADGVIPLSALMVSVTLAVLSALFGVWIAFASAVLLSAALIGFVPFNAPRAQIFLGDTGALLVGTWLAGTALILIANGPDAVLWLMPLLMMPWLSDVLLTMAWRLRRGDNLLQPHKDHLYQSQLCSGAKHIHVALRLVGQVFVVGLLAILFKYSASSAFLAFAAAASFAALVHWRFRHRRADQ